MKITALALGSRGDVQPAVALGVGLQNAGYEVCVNTHAPFQEMVLDAGLEFCLIETNPIEVLESDVGRAVMEGGGNPLRQMRDFAELMHPHMLSVGADCWAACRGAEALLYAQVSWYFGPHIAERLDIPAIATLLHPEYSNGVIPGYSFPIQRNLGSALNKLTWVMEDAMNWYPLRSVINQWREEQLDLPAIPRRVIHQRQLRREKNPTVFGFSPSVWPKPPDWGGHIDVTGYWFLEAPNDWEPPDGLVDFLATGPPPVYVGFGSMSTRRSEEITDVVLQALALSGQRGLLAKGWGGLSDMDLPENLFELESAPHDWLFPQMAAAVHHGGAGTTAASLRAGIPTIILPFWADQPFWGHRVFELGVGPRPIPQKQLTTELLADAITLVASDQEMQQRAAELGRQIRAEDGITRAAEFIHRHLSEDSR
jgi:sterol 3beta-glucosyltransferase